MWLEGCALFKEDKAVVFFQAAANGENVSPNIDRDRCFLSFFISYLTIAIHLQDAILIVLPRCFTPLCSVVRCPERLGLNSPLEQRFSRGTIQTKDYQIIYGCGDEMQIFFPLIKTFKLSQPLNCLSLISFYLITAFFFS